MTSYRTIVADPDFTLYCGDALTVLQEMPAGSVDCCVTSPPYWRLRDYGTSGQVGLERTPEEYVDRLVGILREVRRVLADHGTLWLNLGDSYAAGGNGARDPERWPKQSRNAESFRSIHAKKGHGVKPKDLVGIPWRVAFALQADGWWLRSDIVWSKPNPMPESVKNRPTKSHEYVFLLTKQPYYFFDQEAIREPAVSFGRPNPDASAKTISPNGDTPWLNNRYAPGPSGYGHHPLGRNVRSVWEIATQPYPDAHFATYPEELVRRCILAGTPANGVVLDPFLGSGTTALVARKHDRRSIGIELNPDYCQLAARRCQQLSLLATL